MSFKILNYNGLKTLSNFIKANRDKAAENSTALSELGEDVQMLTNQVAAGFKEVETNLNTLDSENSETNTSLDAHITNNTAHITSTERTNWNDANSKKHEHSNKSVLDGITSALITAWNAAKTHADSDHAPANAEENQNAFSIFVVGSTQIAADSKSDILTLVGSNITLTPDATNDKVTIGLTKANVESALGYTPPTSDTKYTHPTYTERSSGLYKITVDSYGHVSGVTEVTKADITALGIPSTNTTYDVVSTTANGLAPKRDGSTTKFLRGDGTWAVPPDTNTVYTHPSSGVTAGNYGDSTAQTPAYGGTFKVPYITVDANGHVTGISTHNVTIPASDNSDTKNTAGASNTSSKIFLIGATSQAANPQTYSHDTVYIGTDGHLYSDSKQVVNLSGTQELTNKTYNGYTLAAACAREVATLAEARSYLGIS